MARDEHSTGITCDPKELLSLIRSLTRADLRERRANLLEVQGALREAQQALEQADEQTRQSIRLRIHALQRQAYALLREIHPKATQRENCNRWLTTQVNILNQ